MGPVIKVAKDKRKAVQVWLVMEFVVLDVAPVAFAQNEPISYDQIASIPLDDEIPTSRACHVRSSRRGNKTPTHVARAALSTCPTPRVTKRLENTAPAKRSVASTVKPKSAICI